MSKTHENERGNPPLDRPVTEDGIVGNREPDAPRDGEDELDTGLAETGGGDRDKRKIA